MNVYKATMFCAGVCLVPQVQSQDLTLDRLFPSDRVLEVSITVETEDWDTIRLQTRDFQSALGPDRQFAPPKSPYTYVPAQVSIDGVELGTIGLRKKGFLGSQNPIRPSLKIKLNHVDDAQQVEGLTNLTLNNNQQDVTLMSQFMGYQLFNDAGCPAPRTSYAHVTVNGQNLGVYSHVETPREPLLKRGFGNDTGTLFEGTVTDFFADWDRSFETEVGDEEAGLARIRKLTSALEPAEGTPVFAPDIPVRAYVPVDDQLGQKWTAADFDDSDWISGTGGAGYETQSGYESHIGESFDFRDALNGVGSSVYLRMEFVVDDLDEIRAAGDLLLRMKYDDGYVAWLNGHKVGSINAPENPKWNSFATASHGDGAAVQFEPFDISAHAMHLKKGRNVLAVHALNISAESTDMLIAARMEANTLFRPEAVAEHVDLEAFYQFWALEGLLGFWDGYCANRNNFFVYLNPASDRFHFMPWGADAMFEKFSRLRVDPAAPHSVKSFGRVAHVLYQTEEGRKRYAATMTTLLRDHWNEETLLAEVDRIEELVRPHLADAQQLTFRPFQIKEFIRNRRNEIEAELDAGLPPWPAAPGPPPIIRGRR